MEWKPPFETIRPREAAQAGQAVGEVEDAYDLHRQVYRNAQLPLATRLKSATVCIEYERPRLAVVGHTSLGGDFADRLERAVLRSSRARLPPPPQPQVIEGDFAEVDPQGALHSAEHS